MTSRDGMLGREGFATAGELATIVQFSTEMCARCRGVRRATASLVPLGVEFVHVDVTHRPEAPPSLSAY